jgi:hypothetical protein
MRGGQDPQDGSRGSQTDWGGAWTGGYSSPNVVVNADRRMDRLTSVFSILLYAPALMCLPVLLLVGVFVVVPGGFFVVLAAFYWVTAQFVLAALAARRGWQASRSRRRSARTGPIRNRSTTGSPFRPVGAVAAAPITITARDDNVGRAAPTMLPRRREPAAVPLAPADAESASNRQDDARAA